MNMTTNAYIHKHTLDQTPAYMCLNVEPITGDLVDMTERRKVDRPCVQETKRKERVKLIDGIDYAVDGKNKEGGDHKASKVGEEKEKF